MIIKRKKKNISIKDFYERRNKILIKRKLGGFGDILMQRMMFEDFAKTGLDIYYSCPHQFIEMAQDHKFLNNEPIEISRLDEEKFGAIYDITTVCMFTESKEKEKNKKHRSDIWANYCGIELTNHEMHLSLDIESVNFCRGVLDKINPEKKPIILLCTKSSNNALGEAKGMTNQQIKDVVRYVKEIGLFPITTDEFKQKIYEELDVYEFMPITVKTWIALVSICDCVLSVDTATFHLAGGLKRPLIGVFSFTDGKVYGKYYDFVLVQKHRDNGDWACGPCYAFIQCSKDQINSKKPCITELSSLDIITGINKAIKKWKINKELDQQKLH
jgi:ADP-heptose:LPS heptosyltransferase